MKKENQLITDKRKEFVQARRELLDKVDQIDDYKERDRMRKLILKKFKLKYI